MGDGIIEHQLRKLSAGGEDINTLVNKKGERIRILAFPKESVVGTGRRNEKGEEVRKNSKEEIEQAEREETTQERNGSER